MIIDFHTHAFPDALAPRAMATLKALSQYPPVLCGTIGDLRQSMKRAHIDKSVVLNIATNPHQTPSVNNFALSCQSEGGIIPFGSVHPGYADVFGELDRLNAGGIKGIKFHPDFQNFAVDDRKMYPVYERAASLGFIMLFHCGHDLDPRTVYNCTPEGFARVVNDFSGAKIVGAHLGGQQMTGESFKHVCGKNVYLDTSYALCLLSDDERKRLFEYHDGDLLLFGTDSPWQDQQHDVLLTEKIVPDKILLEKIFCKNAAKLLDIS